MDTLTIIMAFAFAVIFLTFLVVSLGDIIKKKISRPIQDLSSTEALTIELDDVRAALREQERSASEKYSRDIEKLKEERELFKKDSFEARLEAQNLNKELAAQRSAHKVLSLELQSLKEQQAGIESSERQAKEESQGLVKDFKKSQDGLQEQYHRSMEECEKLKEEYERFRRDAAAAQEEIERKYQDVGFHKVAFEQLSQEHELLRRQLLDLQELHKSDQANIEDLSRKLELANNTLQEQEEAQKDTEKLEELLEKQITTQKKRAAELFGLEQENKTLKEQVDVLKRELSGFKKSAE
ncbi:MAG TPA: hypothetical protein DCL35_07615 [Candidatus Omnitrophica bacterium]|nr:hypothetical protein [Candidatus Omnitrophota bacterium]